MSTDDLAVQIEQIERRRLRPLVEREMDLARSLHADDYELITPGGRAMSKQAYMDEIASGELDYRVFEPEGPLSIRSWGNAVAVRYRVHIDVAFGDQHDSDLFWPTDIYELRDEHWQVVWSHATRIRSR